VKPNYNHAPQINVRVARHRCPKALPNSQQMADSFGGVKVAGAYVQKAAYRRPESNSAPLNVGGRKSREAGLQPLALKSVYAWPAAATQKALPSSHQMADSVAGVEAAGAYVRKAAYRRSESDSSPLIVGGRKSRENHRVIATRQTAKA
jgi:hypothetical protein